MARKPTTRNGSNGGASGAMPNAGGVKGGTTAAKSSPVAKINVESQNKPALGNSSPNELPVPVELLAALKKIPGNVLSEALSEEELASLNSALSQLPPKKFKRRRRVRQGYVSDRDNYRFAIDDENDFVDDVTASVNHSPSVSLQAAEENPSEAVETAVAEPAIAETVVPSDLAPVTEDAPVEIGAEAPVVVEQLATITEVPGVEGTVVESVAPEVSPVSAVNVEPVSGTHKDSPAILAEDVVVADTDTDSAHVAEAVDVATVDAAGGGPVQEAAPVTEEPSSLRKRIIAEGKLSPEAERTVDNILEAGMQREFFPTASVVYAPASDDTDAAIVQPEEVIDDAVEPMGAVEETPLGELGDALVLEEAAVVEDVEPEKPVKSALDMLAGRQPERQSPFVTHPMPIKEIFGPLHEWHDKASAALAKACAGADVQDDVNVDTQDTDAGLKAPETQNKTDSDQPFIITEDADVVQIPAPEPVEATLDGNIQGDALATPQDIVEAASLLADNQLSLGRHDFIGPRIMPEEPRGLYTKPTPSAFAYEPAAKPANPPLNLSETKLTPKTPEGDENAGAKKVVFDPLPESKRVVLPPLTPAPDVNPAAEFNAVINGSNAPSEEDSELARNLRAIMSTTTRTPINREGTAQPSDDEYIPSLPKGIKWARPEPTVADVKIGHDSSDRSLEQARIAAEVARVQGIPLDPHTQSIIDSAGKSDYPSNTSAQVNEASSQPKQVESPITSPQVRRSLDVLSGMAEPERVVNVEDVDLTLHNKAAKPSVPATSSKSSGAVAEMAEMVSGQGNAKPQSHMAHVNGIDHYARLDAMIQDTAASQVPAPKSSGDNAKKMVADLNGQSQATEVGAIQPKVRSDKPVPFQPEEMFREILVGIGANAEERIDAMRREKPSALEPEYTEEYIRGAARYREKPAQDLAQKPVQNNDSLPVVPTSDTTEGTKKSLLAKVGNLLGFDKPSNSQATVTDAKSKIDWGDDARSKPAPLENPAAMARRLGPRVPPVPANTAFHRHADGAVPPTGTPGNKPSIKPAGLRR